MDISLSIQPSLLIPTTLRYSPLLLVSEFGRVEIITIDQSDAACTGPIQTGCSRECAHLALPVGGPEVGASDKSLIEIPGDE